MTAEEFNRLYSGLLGGSQVTPGGGIQDLNALWALAPPTMTPRVNPSEPYSGLGGFLRSTANSPLEMFGLRGIPFSEAPVEEWRRGSPIGNIASQVLGSLPVYATGLGAGSAALQAGARSVPSLAKYLTSIKVGGAYEKAHPVLAASARLGTELLPLEVARVGAAAMIGDEGTLDEVALSAGLDLALAPLIPAAWHSIKSFLPSPTALSKLKGALPDLDLDAPAQEQLGKLYVIRSTMKPELREIVDSAISKLELSVRAETASEKYPYVNLLTLGDAGRVRRLFKAGQDKPESAVQRKQFVRAVNGGFDSSESVANELKAAGLEGDWYRFVQFPRTIAFNSESGAKAVQKTVELNLQKVQGDWFIREEVDTGLFILARKYKGSEAASGGDKWLVMKTNKPDRFVSSDVIKTSSDRLASFTTKVDSSISKIALGELNEFVPDSLIRFSRSLQESIKMALVSPASKRDLSMFKGIFPELSKATGELRDQVAAAWDFSKHYVAPAMAQFRKEPRAEYIRLQAQALFDAAVAKASVVNFGPMEMAKGQSILSQIFKATEPEGIYGLVSSGLKNEDMDLVSKVLRGFTTTEDINKLLTGVDRDQATRISSFFSSLGKTQDQVVKELGLTQKMFGLDEIEPAKGRYSPHVWVGDHRQRVTDDLGQTIYMAAGRTRDEAAKSAAAAAERLGGRVDEPVFLSDRERDITEAELLRRGTAASLKRLSEQPMSQKKRMDIGGYLGDEAPLNKKELIDILTADVKSKFRVIAEIIAKNDFGDGMLSVLKNYGGHTAEQLAYRINAMSGKQGVFSAVQNKAVDRVLGNTFGKDSATKIVSAYNTAETHLTILAFNLLQPALNLVTFVQTALPKLAMAIGAGPERLGDVLGFVPGVVGGEHIGPISFLEPIKIASKALREMIKPDKLLRRDLDRASHENVVKPQFVEDFLGQEALRLTAVEAERSSTGAFLEVLFRMSKFAFGRTEEISRAHSFIMGRILAKDILGITDPEAIYQVGKQFSMRTMYMYSTSDRPKVFAGPLGGAMGLFKNWTAHNIADWSLYGGEALRRKNWTPLLWALVGNGAVAGVGGLPLYAVADKFSKLSTDKSMMEWLYSAFGDEPKAASDAVYFGLPALLGVSLQSSGSAPFSNPVRDITYLANFALLDRAIKIGKLLEYTGGQFGAGSNPFQYDRTWDLASYALSPKIIYKGLAQVEDGALKAIRNGQPIITGVSTAGRVLNALSLTPIKIARSFELSEELWKEKSEVARYTETLGEAYYQAWAAGDSRAMGLVVQKAVGLGLDVGNIMKSATTRIRTQQQPILEFEFRTLRDVAQRRKLLGLE